jgi:hypothetical protein
MAHLNVATIGEIWNLLTKTVAALETPSGGVKNAQGNDAGAALVEVSGGTVTATVDTSALATAAKQDTLANEIKPSQKIGYYATFAADADLTANGLGYSRRIIIGTAGTLVVTVGGDTVTLPAEICTDGAMLDIAATLIASTSTATKVLVLW